MVITDAVPADASMPSHGSVSDPQCPDDAAGLCGLEIRTMSPHEVLPAISENVRRLVEDHRAYYEVSAHYIVLEQRPAGAAPSARRIQAGFDIDVYGAKPSHEAGPAPEYELGYRLLRELAETIVVNTSKSCAIEAIPFRSTTILDTKNHFVPLAMIRITITQKRGLDQAAGPAEQHALQEMEENLKALGVPRR